MLTIPSDSDFKKWGEFFKIDTIFVLACIKQYEIKTSVKDW